MVVKNLMESDSQIHRMGCLPMENIAHTKGVLASVLMTHACKDIPTSKFSREEMVVPNARNTWKMIAITCRVLGYLSAKLYS